MAESTSRPVLSLVMCSRNDNYAGNSLWRLQTALNYLALQVSELGRESSFEVIVSDWGSETPLREALHLSEKAAALTRFLEVPPDLAKEKQQDSPFAEVLANNAAIRLASGTFVGRIDQDTLVGKGFLQRFQELAESGGTGRWPIESSFMFLGRRSIPYAFSSRCYPLETVCTFLDRFRHLLPREGRCREPWFDAPVGIMVMHRDLWEECRGYDERMIYWGFMETDLGIRVGARHPVVDLEKVIGCDFYHLSHSTSRLTITNRIKNPRTKGSTFSPNNEDWGLVRYPLELKQGRSLEGKGRPTDPGSQKAPDVGLPAMTLRFGIPILNELFWEMLLRPARIALRAMGTHPSQIAKRAGPESR
jgi:hypothetical protein